MRLLLLVGVLLGSLSFGNSLNLDNLPAEIKCSSLGKFLHLTGGKIPHSPLEWEKALTPFGFYRSEVAFSDSLSETSLEDPRYVYTFQKNTSFSGFTYLGSLTQFNFADRLFVAHGTNEEGKKVTEFFSFNPYRGAWDVGTLDPSKKEPLKLASIESCQKCHHTRGPIFSSYPWSPTTASPPYLWPAFGACLKSTAKSLRRLKRKWRPLEKKAL